MAKVTLNVTAKDIKNGESVETGCPIALAAERVGFIYPSVTNENLSYELEGGTEYLELPKSASHFVDSFDADEVVKPFSFSFRVSKEVAATLKKKYVS